jgi:hypothetical protein
MWMLDVFCCALGCVILLLLLKMREANFTAEESANVHSDLDDAKNSIIDSEYRNMVLGAEINDLDGRLALLQKERDDLAKSLALVKQERDKAAKELALIHKQQDATAKELAVVEAERDKAAKDLALVRTERDKASKNLATIEEKTKSLEAELALARKKLDDDAKMLATAKKRDAASDEELAKKESEIAELARKLSTSKKDHEAALVLAREKEKSRAEAIRQVLDYNDRLIAAESKLKNSEKQVDDLMAKSAEAAKTRKRITDLEQQVADANVTIVDLQGTKAKLADKINKLQIESDQRFAGIAMTGRNVVFMVDMSGSMDRTDENTIDMSKWPTVRETLTKVIRSLPDLEQYQVLVFSSRVTYLMGNEGNWIHYDKEKSIEQIRKALAATKPVGDTNLYTAFDETFRFRAKGLDTIYLLSDGLPTSGPGLTPAQEQTLSENDRSVILARLLRQKIRTSWNVPDARKQRVRINSIGFFYESPDVGAFLWALSRDNDGSFVGMSRP